MKMTKTEWRYLQRIALDHPYYDTHKPPLSEAEAKAIVEKNIAQSGREFVDSVYAKLGMSRPAKEKERLFRLHDAAELFAVPPIRRIAIAVLAAVVLLVFFAATPPGRAIAESVIRYFVTLTDKDYVISRNDNEPVSYCVDIDSAIARIGQSGNEKTDFVQLDSSDDFMKATGKTPFALPLPCTELFYARIADLDYLVLYATYTLHGESVVTYQIWSEKEMVGSTSTGYSACAADKSVYYSTDKTEGSVSCIKILDDSVLFVTSEEPDLLNDLLALLANQ